MFTTFRITPAIAALSTYVDLTRFLDYNDDWNLGDGNVFERAFTENALVPGGVLSSQRSGIRRMTVPVVLASTASYGLAQLERSIRRAIAPGGWLEFQGYGASTLMRVDIAGGDLVYRRFNPRVAALGRRPAVLSLDVQPFAYPATGMLLVASTASVGLPAAITLGGASLSGLNASVVAGDVPAFVRIVVAATTNGTSFPAGTWMIDAIGWSITNSDKLLNGPLIGPAPTSQADNGFSPVDTLAWGSPTGVYQPTSPYTIGLFSADSGYWSMFPKSASGWTPLLSYNMKIDPSPRANWGGRFRAFAYARFGPSVGMPWLLSIDVSPQQGRALASANAIATLSPAVATGTPGIWGAQPSPAFQILDLGEVQFPDVTNTGIPSALAYYQDNHFRLWAGPATTGTYGVATPQIDIAGVYLLPVDGGGGILARGLVSPTHSVAGANASWLRTNRFYIDSRPDQRCVLTTTPGSGAATGMKFNFPVSDAISMYRGDFPRIDNAMDKEQVLYLFAGARSIASGATAPLAHTARMSAAVSVEYSPQFVFLPFPEVI